MNLRKLLSLSMLLGTFGNLVHAAPITSAFTYQGQLRYAGASAAGTYDFQFTLYDAATNGNSIGAVLSVAGVGVTNGLFTAQLDFGTASFSGEARWLSVSVRTNGSGAYSLLTPRQGLTAAPYALFAPTAGAAAAAGVANSVANNAVTATGIASGQVVMSLNGLHDAITLAPGANLNVTTNGRILTLSTPTDWHLGGNTGTSPASGSFLGSIVAFYALSTRAMATT